MSERIVTPEQYAEGYIERRGLLGVPRRWHLLRRLADGNYLVEEPEPWVPPEFRKTRDRIAGMDRSAQRGTDG